MSVIRIAFGSSPRVKSKALYSYGVTMPHFVNGKLGNRRWQYTNRLTSSQTKGKSSETCNARKIVLFADDDPDDQLLLKEAFASVKVPAKLYFVEDGEDLKLSPASWKIFKWRLYLLPAPTLSFRTSICPRRTCAQHCLKSGLIRSLLTFLLSS